MRILDQARAWYMVPRSETVPFGAFSKSSDCDPMCCSLSIYEKHCRGVDTYESRTHKVSRINKLWMAVMLHLPTHVPA